MANGDTIKLGSPCILPYRDKALSIYIWGRTAELPFGRCVGCAMLIVVNFWKMWMLSVKSASILRFCMMYVVRDNYNPTEIYLPLYYTQNFCAKTNASMR